MAEAKRELVRCPSCNGAGRVPIGGSMIANYHYTECTKCQGDGAIRVTAPSDGATPS